ncbi:MAG: capsule polysaccharide export protein KpsE/RkpR [Flavobacteriales bacterium]|jgi:capsule polysaccharide export protein KpsE/RkpR
MSEVFNSNQLLSLIIRWWKQLFIVALVAAVLAMVFSSPMFIKPKYKSVAVLYPANIIPMGTETPTEQMLQVFESETITEALSTEFGLYSHYGIDSNKAGHRTKLRDQFEENVSFEKTKYESVVVEVLDEDPKMAKLMVDRLIHNFNIKEKSMQKEKSIEMVTILEVQVKNKKIEMDSLESRLKELRVKYGILDFALQTEYATERYLRVVTEPGSDKYRKEVEPILESLKEHGGEYVSLTEHLWRVRGTYNNLKESLEAAIKDVEKHLTYSNVVTGPVLADKKSYPIRWLIVAMSVVSCLLFALLVLSLVGIEGKKK